MSSGFWAVAHHGLVLLGVLIVAAAVLIVGKPDLRQQAETRLTAWLTERQPAASQEENAATITTAAAVSPQLPVDRATAADPQALPRAQARLALWIARKYQVAPEPMAALVADAYKAGQASHIEPALILAVMAVESGFNPFAQSAAGAQGLMQVMTSVHGDKYNDYGGNYAAFDPLSNLRVGVWVLRNCIDKAGSTAGGLRCYVGAAHLPTDGGYASKVLAEYERMQQVAGILPRASRPTHTANAAAAVDKWRAAPVIVVAALAQAER
ncbi:MAG: lytic transglycosylase domain-containing protein [Burkholderiaceae bacterium]|nr:lytic transglycosylase domain-containing protein [Burkholderiaceae bacterium]